VLDSTPALECLLCQAKYSRVQILAGEYDSETLVCSKCYAIMQKMPHEKSCFGKPSMRFLSGKVQQGYDAAAVECNRICPDRTVCRKIIVWGQQSIISLEEK
jgi:hypothetical protein